MRHLFLAAVAVLIAGPALADDKCMVTDPSGTSLNVRTEPGGKILTTLSNGVTVMIGETRKDAKGREWAVITSPLNGDPKAKGGWVAKDLVSCF